MIMRNKAAALLGMLLLVAILATAGCNLGSEDKKGSTDKQPDKVNAVLYFSDTNAMYLVPENRQIENKKSKELLAQAIVAELIKGPQNKDLFRTIPPEAKVLSVKIDKDTARVDFSEEISSKHGGGSTGESMTIYSIVNSLTELDGIKKVQLLIAGKPAETLAGHLDISQPLERNQDLLQK
jgi:germination protein M